jgi:hypothetical protein
LVAAPTALAPVVVLMISLGLVKGLHPPEIQLLTSFFILFPTPFKKLASDGDGSKQTKNALATNGTKLKVIKQLDFFIYLKLGIRLYNKRLRLSKHK